jgi:flavin reductase (DIM6/NTAB) family NADH-FMN oxidoreductase RutF
MDLEPKNFYRFLAPRTTVIITSVSREKKINAAAVSFVMPVSMDPPLLAVSLSRKVDMDTLKKTREFVVNIPTEEVLDSLWNLSKTKGASPETNEIEKAGFAMMASGKVLAPSIADCIAWFECLAEFSKEMGDHTLVVGSVVHVTVKDEFLGKDGYLDLEKAKVLMHIGGPKFALPGRQINMKEKGEEASKEAPQG